MDESGLVVKVISRFAVDQAGAFWIGALLILLLAWDFSRLWSIRNLSLSVLMLPAIPLMDILEWVERFEAGQLSYKLLLELAFGSLFVITALMAVWGLMMSRGRNIIDWRPNLSDNALKLITVLVLILNLAVVLGKLPDDAGVYTNVGAQRWVETGKMPYADPGLKGPAAPGYGASATYGPLLYVAHIPFQFLLGSEFSNAPDANPLVDYQWPPILASQLACLAFQLIALWALYRIGRRNGDTSLGLSLVILYAGSAYVLGLGSQEMLAGGLVFISHIAPTAMLLLAVYFLDRPFLSGAFVAAGAGVLFFPAFLYPLFFGWHYWRNKGAALRSLAGFVLVGGLIGLMVIWFTGTLDGKGPVQLLLESTLEHQEGFSSGEYGQSPFSFWGNFPALAAFWQAPLIGTTSVFKPTFLIFASYCLVSFFLSRGKTELELALLLASLAAALQLWKTHAAGTYVEWYYPFLLIGLLGRSPHWRRRSLADS